MTMYQVSQQMNLVQKSFQLQIYRLVIIKNQILGTKNIKIGRQKVPKIFEIDSNIFTIGIIVALSQ